jgi:hypothetical protein
MFVLQWAINSGVDRFFWGGSSFGQRRFDNCTIFFLVGLAALFDVIPRWLGILGAAGGSLWTMALFFAPLNLNRYYTPDELLAVVRHPNIRIDLFESVPPNFKTPVLIVFASVVILYAIIAAVIRARPDIVGGAICILIAGWFAICGFNDRAHLEPWSNVIAKNQSGALRDRVALMRDEESYLRRTGNTAEAQRTQSEINEITAHATTTGLR